MIDLKPTRSQIPLKPNWIPFICALAVFCNGSYAVAQRSTDTHRITKSFTEPFEKSIAASAETGIIVQSKVKEGDRVQVGDILAKINQSVLVASLKIAKARAESTARFDAAKSQVELVASQLEAVRSLVEDGHTNKYEVQQKEAEYQTAYAEFRSAQDEMGLNRLEVGRIEAQIEDRVIRSPIDGFVTEIHKQLGENVSNNEPTYATIVRVDELKARFYLDSQTLNDLKPGDRVSISVGKARSKTPAKVIYVSPIIDSDSGLGRLDVMIDNHDLSIKSGTICHWMGMDHSSPNFTDKENLSPTLRSSRETSGIRLNLNSK